jgi:hypothetical protein
MIGIIGNRTRNVMVIGQCLPSPPPLHGSVTFDVERNGTEHVINDYDAVIFERELSRIQT